MSAAEARGYIPTLSDGEGTLLDTLIGVADHALGLLCGHPPYTAESRTMMAQTYTLYLDGPGGRELWLPVRPIASITSIYDDPLLSYGSSTEVVSGDYTSYAADGLIVLDADASHGAWSKARRAIKITASLGFSTAPDPVKHACGLLVAHWYRNTIPSLGRVSTSQGGVSVSLLSASIPLEVRATMAPYVSWAGLLP